MKNFKVVRTKVGEEVKRFPKLLKAHQLYTCVKKAAGNEKDGYLDGYLEGYLEMSHFIKTFMIVIQSNPRSSGSMSDGV